MTYKELKGGLYEGHGNDKIDESGALQCDGSVMDNNVRLQDLNALSHVCYALPVDIVFRRLV